MPASAHTRRMRLTYDPSPQTRMQIINPTAGANYKGVIEGTMRIATGEGILKLWRGMSSVVVGAGMLGKAPSRRAELC